MLRTLFTEKRKRAQTILEYTIVVGVIVAVMAAMTPMIRRVNQGMIKLMSDQVGNQHNAEQRFNANRGYLVESYTTTQQRQSHGMNENFGDIKYTYDDAVTVTMNSLTNAGFQLN